MAINTYKPKQANATGNFKKILHNKTNLYLILGGFAFLFLLIVVAMFSVGESNGDSIIYCDKSDPNGIGGFSFSPDSKSIAIYSYHYVQTWNIKSQTLLKEIKKKGLAASCITFTPSGQCVVVGTANKQVFAWNLETLEEVLEVTEFSSLLYPIHFKNSRCLIY